MNLTSSNPTPTPAPQYITVLENKTLALFDTDATRNTIFVYNKEVHEFFNDLRWSDYAANEPNPNIHITTDQWDRFIKKLTLLSSAIEASMNRVMHNKVPTLTYFRPSVNTNDPKDQQYRNKEFRIMKSLNGIIDITTIRLSPEANELYDHVLDTNINPNDIVNIRYDPQLDSLIKQFYTEVKATMDKWLNYQSFDI